MNRRHPILILALATALPLVGIAVGAQAKMDATSSRTNPAPTLREAPAIEIDAHRPTMPRTSITIVNLDDPVDLNAPVDLDNAIRIENTATEISPESSASKAFQKETTADSTFAANAPLFAPPALPSSTNPNTIVPSDPPRVSITTDQAPSSELVETTEPVFLLASDEGDASRSLLPLPLAEPSVHDDELNLLIDGPLVLEELVVPLVGEKAPATDIVIESSDQAPHDEPSGSSLLDFPPPPLGRVTPQRQPSELIQITPAREDDLDELPVTLETTPPVSSQIPPLSPESPIELTRRLPSVVDKLSGDTPIEEAVAVEAEPVDTKLADILPRRLPLVDEEDANERPYRLPPVEKEPKIASPRRLPPVDNEANKTPTLSAPLLAASTRPDSLQPRRLPLVKSETKNASPTHPRIQSAATRYGFPDLPPDPTDDKRPPLPSLEEELWIHGGAHLYEPEGDRRNWVASHDGAHHPVLRLPEDWQEPRPLTLFQEFLGADPIHDTPHLKWPGETGYTWEPRFVAAGSYELFGIAFEENDTRQDLIGHQLLLDLDLRLTGTERFHVQFRPIGERNTGGSYYQLNDPEGYINNSTAEPDLYWFEFEWASVFGGFIHDEIFPRDWRFTVGKFPLTMHNNLLMSDDVTGVTFSKNTIFLGNLSNLNFQGFITPGSVDAFTDGDADLAGFNLYADWRHVFFEFTAAYLQHEQLDDRDSPYLGLSVTKLLGRTTLTARTLFKFGDEAGRGDGQLYVLEANRTRVFDCGPFGIETAVAYATAFKSTKGWNSISGGNLDRIRTTFAVDPLINIATGRDPGDNTGATLGVQLFRHNEDESLSPEISYESPTGTSVLGTGFRYLRKTGPRSFFDFRGVISFSDDPTYRREGVFASETIVF